MSVRRNASVEANDWADKKRQQLERAKQLREERKNNIMRVAEDQIVGTSSKGFASGHNAGSSGYGGGGMDNGFSNQGGYGQQQYGGGQELGYDMNKGSGGYNNRNGPGNYGGANSGYSMGGGNQFGTGELRNMGYQAPNGGRGPVKATDFGNGGGSMSGYGGNGYSNSKIGGGNSGYDQYDQLNSISTKSSLQTNQSLKSQPRVSQYANQNPQDYNPSGNRNSQLDQQRKSVANNRNPSQRTIDYNETQNSHQNTNGGGFGGNNRNMNNTRTIEEHKSNYQPQKREAPPQQRRGMASNAPRNAAANRNQNNQQSSNNNGPQYVNYDDEVSKQVIPAVARKQGGYGNNLGPEAFQAPSNMDLRECGGCGRSFNPEAYSKHSKICQKVFQKKRKVFNSLAHRIVSKEQEKILAQAQRQERVGAPGRGGAQNKPAAVNNRNNMPVRGGGAGQPKWKNQSEQFRQAMRAARGVDDRRGGGGKNGGGSSYQPPAVDQYDDRVPCPYCGRKFADVAAQRHIPYCQNKSKESAMRGGGPRGGRGGMRR
eukprot:403367488